MENSVLDPVDEPRYRFLLSDVVERWRGEEILLEDEGML